MNLKNILPIFFLSFLATITSNNAKPEVSSSQEILHKAILNDSAEEVKKAVRFGANVNSVIDSKLPILWAVLLKKSNAVEALLDCGAKTEKFFIDISLRFYDVRSAILIALKGNYDLNAIYPLNQLKRRLLSHAIWGGCLKEFLLLIQAGADFYYVDRENASSEIGSPIDAIVILIATKFCCYHRGDEDISLAFQIFEEMIKRGLDVQKLWFSKASFQLGFNRYGQQFEKVLHLMIQNGAEPNHVFSIRQISPNSQWTPLFAAIYNGHVDAVSALLDAGADINYKSLPFPADSDFCSPNIKRGCQYSPLSFAIKLGLSDKVELLLKRGANL